MVLVCCVLQLTPLFSSMEYLEGQHLIVTVKTSDGMESYGKYIEGP